MNGPLTYFPAYLGLFISLFLALVCNNFLDIEYGSFGFEAGFWAIAFGWTLFVGWRQSGAPSESAKQIQKIVLLLAFVMTLLIFIPKWGFPRAGIYMLAGLQAAQNCATTSRRQLHFGLLVSAVLVMFAASHFRADWTMLFYLVPYVVAVVFTLVSEQISRRATHVRESSLGRTGPTGQWVAIAAATAIILGLGGVLYLATPQPTWPHLVWRYGQMTNMGFVGDPENNDQSPQGASAGDGSEGDLPSGDGLGLGLAGAGASGSGWPTPGQMREAAGRPGMPEWQSATIMQMADLDEAISEALAPFKEVVEQSWHKAKAWLKEHRDTVLAVLFALMLVVILLAIALLLKEARAGTWLRTRFDYWRLVKFGKHAEGHLGALQFYRAMERLFIVRNAPRLATANAREFLGETTHFRADVCRDAAELTRLFEIARYGPRVVDSEQLKQMRVLYQRLFKNLG